MASGKESEMWWACFLMIGHFDLSFYRQQYTPKKIMLILLANICGAIP
jgi:hypothetical protein